VTPDASWALAPGPLVLLASVTLAYVLRWRRAGASVPRLLSFLAGVVVLAAALVSPIDTLAEQLFVMHMVQHVLLLDVAPVLLLLGLTRVILRPLTRRVLLPLERGAGALGRPAFAVVLYVGVMWLWHVPAFYDAASEQPVVHAFGHLLFAAAGTLYWWHVVSPVRPRRPLRGLGPVAYMVSTKVLVGLLGVALTFAPSALYAFYEEQPRYWGLSARDDQALGGVLMSVEQSIVMGIALAVLFARMLGESDREEQRLERYGSRGA
jgi:putative membrane protein